jgi:preprotein translocase subunit SecB
MTTTESNNSIDVAANAANSNSNASMGAAAGAKQAAQPEFGIQRIYIKDLSFEAPHSPEIFRTDWTPEVVLDLNTSVNKIGSEVYEVVIKVIVTVKAKEKIAFLVEVQQAGIFTMKGFAEDQLSPMLGSFCPNILFPYAREVVSDVVSRGTFPPLYLSPVNFDALYQQYLDKQQTQTGGGVAGAMSGKGKEGVN